MKSSNTVVTAAIDACYGNTDKGENPVGRIWDTS